MEKNTHPFVSWEEQLHILNKKHNINIATHKTALESLKTYSYYTLVNGYQQALEKEQGTEEFIDGIAIEQLALIHIIETRLASELLHAIISIEKKMKSIFQYQISKDISYLQDVFLSKEHYISRQADKSKTLNKLRRKANFSNQVSSSLLKYRSEGNVPPWILINDITFGEFKHWYIISPSKIKENTVNEFNFGFDSVDTNLEFFKQALDFLVEYRNGLAHGDVINKIIPKHHLPFDKLKHFYNDNVIANVEYTKQGYGKNDLFGLIMLISIFTPEYEKKLFKEQIVSFIDVFDSILPISEAPMRRILGNIPPDIFNRIDNIFKIEA
ncbi:Abi family protein [Fructobacillus tropaeoli]|uniref:Abi family protein n=1 Tax=Fructobacillus tropaeoli TaxID=709323 RepID=UPI0019424FBE|nr:Abi family protein [Fructobacillus tropaeoli]GIC70573.1 Abi family protein [Fructobacillus tropaeoli]